MEQNKTTQKPSVTAEKSQVSDSLLAQRDNDGTNHAKFTGHTPGPWKQIPDSLDIISETRPGLVGRFIAEVLESKNPGVFVENDLEAYANARLIAAAPELLEACKKVMSFPHPFGSVTIDVDATLQVSRAIAKAEGLSPDSTNSLV